MGELSSTERGAVESAARRADARPGARLGRGQQRLAQPRRPRRMADLLAEAFAAFPGVLGSRPAPVDAVDAGGRERSTSGTAATST